MALLPNNWAAREYQKPFMQYMLQGGPNRKRAVMVWHRRSGKDSTCANFTAVAAHMRVGTYWHMLPTLNQGRKVVWDAIDRDGRRLIDQAFPEELRASVNETEMKIRFKNGSVYQVVGSDNYDSLVGANPVGLIMSEYAVADPTAWDLLRPILLENGGWAVFPYTPRGKNHGWKLFKMAETNPAWFCQKLSIDDTFRADGSPVMSPEDIEEERRSGMSEEKIQQEYFCSFEGGLEGAYYTNEIALAYKDGRVGDFPHNPEKSCQSWWDIGFRDSTAIIITQRNHYGKPDVIDYLEGRNKSLEHWIRDLRSLPYDYDEWNGPHDLENHDFTTGRTRLEFAQGLGVGFDVVAKIPVPDGIDATRAMLRVARFDKNRTGRLLDCLSSYRREYDEHAGMFRDKPCHDWTSHGADAMRYLSVGWRDGTLSRRVNYGRHTVKRAAPVRRLTNG